MTTIRCPKCKKDVEIDISKSVDEYGEVFVCPSCKYKFRYAPNG